MSDPLSSLERAGRERDEGQTPAHRARRGIVHTPPAIARWIARACAGIDGEFTLIDPACGPGVFLAAALGGLTSPPTLCLGVDVDADAIALARRELTPLFAAAGWPLELRARDALDDVPEVRGAAIVIGNPPWTARTASRGVTDALLDDFRRSPDGADLGERKIGVLSDAYVRFLRWAVAVVERAPRGGRVAMVVSSSFLDGRVHRGMRAYLAAAFDRIDLVDLGGSALVARAGSRDENVFGVRPGAAIVIGARDPGTHARSAIVRSLRLRGSKDEKLARLETLRQDDPAFVRVPLLAPLFRFVPSSSAVLPTAWPTLDQWMPWSREGVQTNRDALCVDASRAALLQRVRAFIEHPDASLARGHFDPIAAAARLRQESAPLDSFVVPLAYRPLDQRWLFMHPALCHRARPEIAAALAHDPLALVTASKDRGERAFAHLGVVTTMADNCWLSSRSSCRARITPARTPVGDENVGAEVRASLRAIAVHPSVREVMAYLAAWLSAPSFRSRFDESLRIGPIRVPLPTSAERFRSIAAAGEKVLAAFVEDISGATPGTLGIGHRDLDPTPRAGAIALAQHATDALVRDLVGSPA